MPDSVIATASSEPGDSPCAEPDLTATLGQLFIYPVKSCAGVAVERAVLTDTGLDLDRAWMVVDAQQQFLTQREMPRMALIQPQIKSHEIVLRAPGMLALHLALDQVEGPARAQVWNDELPVFDMGPLAAQWFSDFLGVTARLVRFDPDQRRLSSLRWTGGAEALNQFSDGYPILVASQASLDALNVRLAAAGSAPVTMARFRPNLVLASAASFAPLLAHDEDRVATLRIETDSGTVTLKPVKPCARCPMVDVDPLSAVASTQVGDMLRTYRADPRLQGAISFGMNAIILQGEGCELRVGQNVSANYVF
jgi:uncharacterized protein